MADRKFIKPATADLKVRKPAPVPGVAPGWLAPEGEAVTWSPYWQRRLRDGDVIEAAAPVAGGTKRAAKEG